ncbi:MAG: hypothetical protein KBT36_14425 [Kurthia sp.]|nr:hypothetical protein [Candidatus Kurthia equi]
MDKKRELKKMSVEMLERVEKVKSFELPERLSVTKLARSSEWRSSLQEKEILEILDRTETIGIMLSLEAFEGIQMYIKELEAEIELMEHEKEILQVQTIVESRKDYTNYLSGKELEDAALQLLDEGTAQVRGILNDDSNN